jgi:microcystin-dependent protein
VNEAWKEDSQSLRAEVTVLQQQVQALLMAQQPRASTDIRRRVFKSIRFIWLPFGITLAAVSALYGAGAMDALFIDQQGRIGIGTTTPEHVVDIRSKDTKTPFSIDNALYLDNHNGTVRITNNAFVNDGGQWQIKDAQKKAFTLELRDSGMLELYGTTTNGEANWRKMATFDAPNNAISFQAPVTLNGVSLQNSLVPVGTMMAYGGDTTNQDVVKNLKAQGWLPCDGSAVSRKDYDGLFAAIGTAFGAGNSPSTFNVPDLRGRFPRGTNQNSGRDPDAGTRRADPAGANSGNQVGSVQDDEFKSHTHGYSETHYVDKGGNMSGSHWSVKGSQTTATGGKETRPKNLYVNWIIKAKHT